MNNARARSPSIAKLPYLAVSDGHGAVFEIPGIYMAGMSLSSPVLPGGGDLIELPCGSDLFHLPGRRPVGYDPRTRSFVEITEFHGVPVWAVAAFMSPAYVQILRAAYRTQSGAATLPLYSYTAVGWKEGGFFVAGKRIDPDRRQDWDLIDIDRVNTNAVAVAKRYPTNRLVQHIVDNCVFRYGCPAARNFVLGRWECPLPTSRACNAACLGCISRQSAASSAKAPHERIGFLPTVEEIVEVAVPHLQTAPRAVVSFGQGCEGEPLTVAGRIADAIARIRGRTSRGIININTNAGKPALVERLCEAGLDSIRVSMNSARERCYGRYYRPRDYAFEDVVESLKIVRRYGRWASINYFVLPGFTDHPEEMAALERVVKTAGVDMIQTRNLNMDPELYIAEVGPGSDAAGAIGIRPWIAWLRKRFPGLKLGYFNPPREVMTRVKRRHAHDRAGR